MDDEAVSAVIGTVLVLGISVAGIGAVLFWGAPLIQEMQDRNAQASVASDMLQVREAAGRLTGVDASRSIGIAVPAGTLGIDPGAHLLVAASYEADCTPDLDSWTDGDGTLQTAVVGSGCTPVTDPADVAEILPIPISDPAIGAGAYLYRLDDGGATSIPVIVVGPAITAPFDAIDIESHDWLFEVRAADGTLLRQYWMLRSDVLSWGHQSSVSDRSVHFAWGPVLSERDEATFAEGQYFASESAFGADDYFLRLNALRSSTGGQSVTGAGAHGVLVGLEGVTEHASGIDTHALRFETFGTHAESFCNTFGARNILAPDDPLYGPCDEDGTDVYATAYSPASTSFRFELLHAHVSVHLQI